jgi:hypothetical protein
MPQRPYFAGFNAGLTCDSEREDESDKISGGIVETAAASCHSIAVDFFR